MPERDPSPDPPETKKRHKVEEHRRHQRARAHHEPEDTPTKRGGAHARRALNRAHPAHERRQDNARSEHSTARVTSNHGADRSETRPSHTRIAASTHQHVQHIYIHRRPSRCLSARVLACLPPTPTGLQQYSSGPFVRRRHSVHSAPFHRKTSSAVTCVCM